jgi:WD40 repeat protein
MLQVFPEHETVAGLLAIDLLPLRDPQGSCLHRLRIGPSSSALHMKAERMPLWASDDRWTARQFADPPIHDSTVSPMGDVAIGGSDFENNIQVIDVRTDGDRGFTIKSTVAWEYTDVRGQGWERHERSYAASPRVFAWSPTGDYLVTGSGNPERLLRIYDLLQRRYRSAAGRHAGDLQAVAWSPRGAYIASSSTWSRPGLQLARCTWSRDMCFTFQDPNQIDLDLDLRDTTWGTYPEAEIQIEHEGTPPWESTDVPWESFYGFGSLGFSPDERWLAVGLIMRDRSPWVAVLSLPAMQPATFFELPVACAVTDLEWNASSDRLFIASWTGLVFSAFPFSTNADARITTLPLMARRLCRSRISDRLALVTSVAGDGIGVEPGDTITILDGDTLVPHSCIQGCGHVNDLAWSTDDRHLFAVCRSGELVRFDEPEP